MTEADAKTKICHRSLRMPPDDKGIAVTNCLGSFCMAWRWSDNGSVNAVRARSDKSEGFCGLAGAVQ